MRESLRLLIRAYVSISPVGIAFGLLDKRGRVPLFVLFVAALAGTCIL